MLKRIFIFLSLFWCATVVAQETASQTRESERFHREAWLLHESRSYELALEKAEAAFALAPETRQYKETLIQFLSDTAQSLLINRIDEYPYSGGNIIATPEGATRSLVLMNRAFDLVEKDPAYFNSEKLGPPIGAYQHSFVDRYFELIPLVRPDIFPKWKTNSDKFKSRIIADWTNFRYPHRCKLVVDAESFARWQNLAAPPYIYNHTLSNTDDYAQSSTIASWYEIYFRDLFAFRKKFSHDSTARPMNDFLAEKYRRFASIQLNPSARQDTAENRRAKQIVERTLKTFSLQDSVYFDVYAWSVLRKATGTNRGSAIRYPSQDADSVEKYYKAIATAMAADEKEIRDKIKSVPEGTPLEDYVVLYSALIEMLRSHPYTELPTPGKVERMLDVFEFALDRGDLIYEPIMVIVDNDRTQLPPKELRRMADACKRAQEALESGTASIGHKVQWNGNIKENLRLDYEMYMEAIETTSTHMPWKDEVVLFEENFPDVSFSSYIDMNGLFPSTCFDGETLCALKCEINGHERQSGTVRPVLVDLNTLQKTELALWGFSEEHRGSHDKFATDWKLFCGTKYVCLGTNGYGIVIFPRDGQEPFVINTDLDLPDDHIQGLGLLGETLYAGVGVRGTMTWLVKIDLPSRNVDILSSSRGRTGKAPFFDLLDAPVFRLFVYDSKRDRLLFHVQMSSGQKHPREGLWTIDGKSGKIDCLTERREVLCALNETGNRGEILADGDTYLSGHSGQYFLTDLRDGTVTPLFKSNPSLDMSYSFVEESPSKFDSDGIEFTGYFRQCTVQQNWIWGFMRSGPRHRFFFVRVDVDNPVNCEKLFFSASDFPPVDEITTFVATPDGKGLVRQDTKKITLIRL